MKPDVEPEDYEYTKKIFKFLFSPCFCKCCSTYCVGKQKRNDMKKIDNFMIDFKSVIIKNKLEYLN